MTDDRELAGLDPFALLDSEAGHLDAFLSGLGLIRAGSGHRGALGGRYETCSGI